jgi:hypothetical protein
VGGSAGVWWWWISTVWRYMAILYADGWSKRETYQQNYKIHKTVWKKVEKIALLQIRTNMIKDPHSNF